MESHNPDVDLKFRDKLELFGKLSCSLTDKLESLLHLSENYTSTSSDFKQFADGIVGLWVSVNKQVKRKLWFTYLCIIVEICTYLMMKNFTQIYDKCSKIRMASRTQSGVPLALLLKRIKKERAFLTQKSLQVYESEHSREELAKCYVLLNEVDDLINNLERCDDKARIYKYCSQYLMHLHVAGD